MCLLIRAEIELFFFGVALRNKHTQYYVCFLQIMGSLSIWLRIRISRAVQNSKKGCTWCTYHLLLLLNCYQKNASAPFIVLRFPSHTIGNCPVYLQPQHVHGTPCRALYFLKGSGFKLAFALYIQYSLYLLVVRKNSEEFLAQQSPRIKAHTQLPSARLWRNGTHGLIA